MWLTVIITIFSVLKTVTVCFHSTSQSSAEGGSYTGTGTKADLDNHANQCNPNHKEYSGYSSGYSGTGTKADLDNHANQLNPNNPNYQPKGGK